MKPEVIFWQPGIAERIERRKYSLVGNRAKNQT